MWRNIRPLMQDAQDLDIALPVAAEEDHMAVAGTGHHPGPQIACPYPRSSRV